MTYPASIISLEPEAFLELFKIDNYRLANPAEAQYFANHLGITLDGISYTPVPLESSGFDADSNGPTAQPTITIGNVAQAVNDFVNQLKGPGYRLEGARVTRRLIQRRYLDDGPEAAAAIKGPPADVYTIEQLAGQNREAVTFKLRTAFETEGVMLPSRLALRTCSWEYRGDGCNYAGPFMTIDNQPTTDASLDRCPLTLTGCEARFGQYSELPFGGYPGLGNY